ncbi:hypothetical protein OHB36_33870 [Streptomyces sp. NBC_00320]|uniref:hypothetical protein n=1 Tax=Streptomyces sp. NBC_00320 TaxID=2975711 RepID=UPI002251AF6E|nr:hypothetical protein [Streptomyces sp. NBC_00320]MCX5151684.1 hypothetical protein [Streptomyces sp. NBC_00320]
MEVGEDIALLGEVLRDAGYATYAVGTWLLTRDSASNAADHRVAADAELCGRKSAVVEAESTRARNERRRESAGVSLCCKDGLRER